MARPQIKISERQVAKLARWGATNVEIAEIFEVDEGTIRKRFSVILTKARSEQKVRLRMRQLRVAHQGNPTMLIWLGKQILGQTDDMDLIEARQRRDRKGSKAMDLSGLNTGEIGELLKLIKKAEGQSPAPGGQ